MTCFIIITLILSIIIQIANANFILKKNVYNGGRIVGGQDATNIDIPWQVSLIHFGVHHCGGSIINNKTVITAAHCLYGLNKRFVKVRVGSKFHYKGGELYTVKGWIAHEGFEFSHMKYDVAIIFLTEEIKFVEKIVEPIKLAEYQSKLPHGTKAMVSGWGLLTPNGGFPDVLQYGIIPVWVNDICIEFYKNKIDESMICAGFLNGTVDACQMDSGGPLVANNILVGIVSWGSGCAKPERPGVYSSISALRIWIDLTLNIAP